VIKYEISEVALSLTAADSSKHSCATT